MTFTKSDLLITDQEQTSLTSALASSAQPDPLAVVMAEQVSKVDLIALPYDLPEGWLKSIARAHILFDLYSRVGAIPDNVKAAYERAKAELEEIRAGKYINSLKSGQANEDSAISPSVGEDVRIFRREDQDGL
jgi:hypothetical protein